MMDVLEKLYRIQTIASYKPFDGKDEDELEKLVKAKLEMLNKGN